MPRKKGPAIVGPNEIAKTLEERQKAVDESLVAKLNESLAADKWEDGEPNKQLKGFDTEEQQARAAELLAAAGWRVTDNPDCITVERPSVQPRKRGKGAKPAAAAKPATQKGTRRASRDPAPVGASE